MGWFTKEKDEPAAPAAAPERRAYRFEDFVDSDVWSRAELPEEATRLDHLERELKTFRERVSVLESEVREAKSSLEHTEQSLKAWFKTCIQRLADDAAKKFAEACDSELLVAALERANVSEKIEQVVREKFEAEAQVLFEAVCRGVLKRLGRGL